MFTFPILAQRDVTATEALKQSFYLLKKHWLMASLLYLVFAICSFLGCCALCIGLLVSLPLMYVVPTLVYRDFTMGRGQSMPTEVPSQ